MALIDRVVLINDFSQVKGGAAALVLLLARQLADRKIPVTLITGDQANHSEPDHPFIQNLSLESRSLLDRSVASAAIDGLYNRAASQLLSSWIRQNDTPRTVYHLHNWSHILSPSIFNALRMVSHRTLIHAHDYFLVCPNGAFTDYNTGLDCPLVPMSSACIRTNCDKRTFLQKTWRVARQAVREYVWNLNLLETNILIIHSGMAEKFTRSGVYSWLVHDMRNPSIPFTATRVRAEENRQFVFIGRLDEEKGVEDFLVAARMAGALARVVGDGQLLQKLAAEYPEVQFDGWRSRDEIAQIVASARMIVVPSRYPEPFGLVISESLASGLPVILNHTALLKEEVIRHGIGISCDTRSAPELASVIRSMTNDDAGVEAMSKRAFGLRESLAITPSVWSDRIIDIYESVLEKQPSGDNRKQIRAKEFEKD